MDRYDESASASRHAIELKPDYAGAYNNLGASLQALGRFEESVSALRRAIELKPDLAWAHNNLGVALLNLNRLDEADAAYRSAIHLKPGFAEADSNRLMCLNYLPDASGEALLPEHRAWDQRHASGFATLPHANSRDPERRLRIGYVSGDLRRHSVAYSLIDVLTAHNGSDFEVFCYSTSATVDGMTERLRGASDHWRGLAGVSDDDAAAMVRDDAIDILIDLSGHTAGNRLLLFARKPAPVQVNWMGYPNTTGMAAMDYRLVDPITDPPGIAEAWASEALVRLQGGFLCYAPPPEAPEVAPPPSLASGAITFGSFNNPPKLSDPTIETWAGVLRRVPTARLLLKGRPFIDSAARALMQARFAGHGIGPERLILLGWTAGVGSHLEAYGQIDIGLDPFPYNGTTTTCEALWMGVPVVTLLGERHVARVGASLLSRVGLQDLIAEDPGQYIEIAAGLAQDSARLASLRQGLRHRVKARSLGDGLQFTPTLEAALRQMWRRWCAGEPAMTFDVPAPM
jgi:predicted O-linked N-acetylglucosamine transferase (SPINDLY family)